LLYAPGQCTLGPFYQQINIAPFARLSPREGAKQPDATARRVIAACLLDGAADRVQHSLPEGFCSLLFRCEICTNLRIHALSQRTQQLLGRWIGHQSHQWIHFA
jgi:hypothetical protein